MSYLSAPSDRDYAAERGEAVSDDTDDVVWCDWCGKNPAYSGVDPLCNQCRDEATERQRDADGEHAPNPIDTLYEYAEAMGLYKDLSF